MRDNQTGTSFDHPSENYYISTNNIEWSCKSDAECTANGSICREEQCQCSPGYVFNNDMTACLRVAKAYGDKCEETIQCSRYLFIGGQCIENACICAPGFHYLHGRCYKTVELTGKCKNDDDCYINFEFGSTVCDNGICKCRDGFYQREYRSCRKKANINEECLVDIDCKFNKDAYCVNFKCTLEEKKTSYNITSRTSFNSHYRKFADKYDKYLLTNRDTINNSILIYMTEAITEWNDCIKDSDCKIHENAICDTSGKCICKRAHFVPSTSTNKVCVPELGQHCKNNDLVNIKNSICKNEVWNCANTKLASKNNQECLKATRKYNSSCQRDEHCSIFGPDAICKNRRCLCNEERSHFVEELQFCWSNKGMNESCKANEDCYVEGLNGTLVCTNNVCYCSEGTHSSSNGTACINSNAELGMFCEYDEHCTTSHSVCTNNVCTCDKTYYELKKRCYPGINANCILDKHCQPMYSSCSSGVCTCKEGYVSSSTSTCLPKAKYGEECSHDIQCNAVTSNAICSWNSSNSLSIKSCGCGKDRYFRYSSCLTKKLLGESCMSRGECYLDFNQNRAICMNGLCTCDWQYVQVSDTVCEKNLKGFAIPGGAIETFSRSSLPILSISLILLDLIR
ncbi:prion-like-(Q/N-rich) domain-bearing protein 25 isoform X2 [Vespa velutina]|uniref:prion-like-(Q/N-rich) domain-bearing protein 25 isoform X2 n=1 Tax=Vespa velutina TaxID=202808 RepID=UPI001FB1BD6D|nr:prion-like-(Q/N-rich) domain-bearing protein 25 isoform X2 [Vespa velutina]